MLKKEQPRPRTTSFDRVFWVALRRWDPTELSDQEQAVGFKVAEIPNSKGHYMGATKTIRAAVLRLPDDKIAVESLISGHVRYGVFAVDTQTGMPQGRALEHVRYSVSDLKQRFGI